MEELANEEARRGLTPADRAAVLGLALVVFAFVEGPVWRHAWNPDASILWSYAVIPALVVVLLARRNRLRFGAFLGETLVLCVFKFGISAIVLIGFWSFSAPPAALGVKRPSMGKSPPEISLNGEEGRPGAVRDLPSPSSLTVSLGDGRIEPPVIPLVAGGSVSFRAVDGRLHALELLAADGSVRANVPILASGPPRALSFEEISGASSVRCAVHPEERAEIRRR